jgi:hypothetical protein
VNRVEELPERVCWSGFYGQDVAGENEEDAHHKPAEVEDSNDRELEDVKYRLD